MNQSQIKILKAAAEVATQNKESGRVSLAALAPIGEAIAIGVKPPYCMEGHKPLCMDGVRAPSGSWPHFCKALIVAESQSWDLAKIQAQGQSDERMAKRANFFSYILNAVEKAFSSALRIAEEENAANERREATRKATEEDEATRKAREARQAARDALMKTALGNANEPVVRTRTQSHARLSVERIQSLLKSQTEIRREDGKAEAEAKLGAARFLVGIVLDAQDDPSYTDNEIALFKREVLSFVTGVFFAESGKLEEAEAEAQNWIQRTVGFSKRQDSPAKPSTPATAPNQRTARPRTERPSRSVSQGTMAQKLAAAGLVPSADASGDKAANG